MTYPDAIVLGFLAAAALGCIVLSALAYTPADFNFLVIDNGEIVGEDQ